MPPARSDRRCRVPLAVAGDQLRVVEVVAGIHAHPRRQPGAEQGLLVLVQQRELDAVDLAYVRGNHVNADIHRRHGVAVAEITFERRIEHLAEPMDDAGLAQPPSASIASICSS